MPRVLLGHAEALEVFWRWTPDRENGDIQFLDAEAAEAWLRWRSTDADVISTLRRVLADQPAGIAVSHLGRFELLDQVASHVRSGWLRVARRGPEFAELFPLSEGRQFEVADEPVAVAPQRMPPPSPAHQQCSNPACATAFSNAASDGSAFVERGGEGC